MCSEKVTMYRFAILTSHPIQYQAPFFRELATTPGIELAVYFRKKIGAEKWDIPLFEGYKYEFVRNAAQFLMMMKRKKPNALMLYGWNSIFNVLVLLALKLFAIPIFVYGENPFRHELRKNRFKIFIKKNWFGFLFSRVSAFLYIGEENRRFYEFYGVPEEKLFFAPYAVDNESFLKAAKELKSKKNELMQSLKIKKGSIVILFAGKLIKKKRPFDLIQAFEGLNSMRAVQKNYSLVFVGDGGLKPVLENYVRRNNLYNIHFVGFRNQTQMPFYYAMADIFVLPSGISETWGLVVNEAMCFGLPIIISDMVGCGSNLVRNGENGFVFPVGNKHLLASALAILVNNPEKRKKFGEKSLEIIKSYIYKEDIRGIYEALRAS